MESLIKNVYTKCIYNNASKKIQRSQFMNNKNVDIDLSFNKKEYFKIQTGISPWKDSLYLYYFNNRNLDLPENEIEILTTLLLQNLKEEMKHWFVFRQRLNLEFIKMF